jgi:membrane protease YdiL (CAAX protease family)
MALGASFNYLMPYDPSPTSSPTLGQILLWTGLYLSLPLFTIVARWRVKDFGFTLSSRMLVASLPLLTICALLPVGKQVTWNTAIVEAFARGGEEVFFRGFLFLVLVKLFASKSRPWLWAALVSALLFALVHTQTFQASYFENASMGRFFLIVQRLFNVFLVGVVLALVRHWSHSLLPAMMFHAGVQSGIAAMLLTIPLYVIISLWAYVRGERLLLDSAPFARGQVNHR